MKKQSKTAKVIARFAKSMAFKAGGAASGWGIYQPTEPKMPKK